jgi:putative ABC transport system permease protein
MKMYLILLKESLLFALNALIVNRLRTFLSLLGITIGIFAIISVFTMVDSMERQVTDSIASLGDNVVFVQKWPWAFGGDYPWWKYLNRPQPGLEDMEAITKRVQSAEAACFMVTKNGMVTWGRNSFNDLALVGVSHSYPDLRDFELVLGRYMTASEAAAGRPVVILGYAVAALLFDGENPIGKQVKLLGKYPATVIGVFDLEGESSIGNSHDESVVMPINYVRTFADIRNTQMNQTVMVAAKEGFTNLQLKDEMMGVLRASRRLKPAAEENFALNESVMLQKGFESLMSVLRFVGMLIGAFSILVGGFGIANIMFVSVKERTRIIGIQKALGAKDFFILFQFLSEAVILCIIGGVVGLILVFLGTLLINAALDLDIYLSAWNITLALLLSTGIGLISGIIPAFSASRLKPVEAMRSV